MGWGRKLLVECAILAIHTPFFLYGVNVRIPVEKVYQEFGLNQLITILMISRMYMIIKVFGRFSKYSSHRTVKLCYKYYVEPSVAFAVKAFLKKHPYVLTMVCLVSIISVFGYAVQTFEISYPTSINYIDNLNPYWNVVITFTTTGYGDIFPVTHFGRLASTMSMFFGQFIISLILLAMSISATFTLEEQKAFRDLKDIEYYDKRAKLAAHIISVHALIQFCERSFNKDKEEDDEEDDKKPKSSDRKRRKDKEKEKEKTDMPKPEKTGKEFKFQRFKDIGLLRGSQRLRVKYDGLVKEFKGLIS